MKYHICREKMQLSRAKPGNPASTVYMTIYAVISIMHTRSFEDKTNYFISVYCILLEYYVCVCDCACVLCV